MCSSVRGIDWDDYEEPSLSTVHVGIHGDGHGDRGPVTWARGSYTWRVCWSPLKEPEIRRSEDPTGGDDPKILASERHPSESRAEGGSFGFRRPIDGLERDWRRKALARSEEEKDILRG